jgi:hypothetical protein
MALCLRHGQEIKEDKGMYRVYKNGNKKQFVTVDTLKFAKSIAKEEIKRGNEMEIKELRGNRWFKIEF